MGCGLAKSNVPLKKGDKGVALTRAVQVFWFVASCCNGWT